LGGSTSGSACSCNSGEEEYLFRLSRSMNHCLYCNKPGIDIAIFCDECRASLLTRQHPSASVESECADQPVWTIEQAILSSTGNTIDTFEENAAIPISTAPPRSIRKSFSTRARTLLGVFILIAAISLIADSILLAANIVRRHTVPVTTMVAITGTDIVLSHSQHGGATTLPGETQTPAVIPVTGTPALIAAAGTGTSTTTTKTPVAGTPTPADMPGLTPTFTPGSTTSCALQVAPSHLSFTATLLQPDPPGQTITLKTTGNCGEPVTWKAAADFSWIQFSSAAGSDNGYGSSVTAYAHSNSIIGIYTAHITFTAIDNNGITLQSNPQTITVTLTVIG
jgi:hypothetical protein